MNCATNAVFLLITCCLVGTTYCQSLEHVKNLTRDLLDNYDKRQRPVKDQSEPVYVNVSLDILTIQDVDEVTGQFSIVALMYLLWMDESLVWDPTKYGYAGTLLLNLDDVWYPKLALTNPSSSVGSLVQDWTPVRVIFYGGMAIIPVNLFQSTCAIDVTYYPFDTQLCSLYFSPLSYGSTEMRILSSSTEVLKNYYQENGEWHIEQTQAASYTLSGGDNIAFSFKLTRKPKFVVVNVILPIVFMAAINILVFVLPADSGERVGFSVTMLLALAVFLTLVGDNLPKTSEPMPILGDYLITILILSLLMCVVAIINLRFHHKPDRSKPPKCCQLLAKLILCRGCRTRKVSTKKTTEVKPFSLNESGGLNKSDYKTMDDEGTSENNISWKDFSSATDVICLIVFVLAVVAVNGYFLYVLSTGKGSDNFNKV